MIVKMPMIEIPREEDVIKSTIIRNIKRRMNWWTNVWVKEDEKNERLIMIKKYITSYENKENKTENS